MDRPNIKNFSDVVLFLKACFEFEKMNLPDFTLRKWATSMDFASPKTLVQILRGSKQIRLKEISNLLKGLDLNPLESHRFETMVLLNLAKDPIEKRILAFSLMRLEVSSDLSGGVPIAAPHDLIEVEDEEVFSSWVDAALISALELKSARKDLNIIKENLLWEPDREQVNRSADRLKANGLMIGSNDLKSKTVSTRSDRSHAGAKKYYQQMNQISTLALEMPLIEREFQGFSLPTHSSQIPLFKQLIRDFRNKLSCMSSDAGNIVVQFNLQMFPLTKKLPTQEALDESLAQL